MQTFRNALSAHLAERVLASQIKAAGLALVAFNTKRVLMIQRGLDPKGEDPAAGKLEFPGGHLDPGEDPLDAARREFLEETGADLPEDTDYVGSWVSSNGIYQGFLGTVKEESDIVLTYDADHRVLRNPELHLDAIETVIWWDVDDLRGNPAVRQEIKDNYQTFRRVYDAIV